MTENQPLIDELIAAAGGDVGDVDVANPVDVESYLINIVMGANKLSDAEFAALSNEAQTWLNDVAQAMNSKGNLADAAFTENGLRLADLPSASAPVPKQAADDGGGDASAKETPPSAPEVRPEPQEAADAAGEAEIPPSALVSRPEPQADSKTASDSPREGKVAFSKRNPWGRGTKTRSAIDVIIASNGKASLDLDLLTRSVDGGVAEASLKLCANFALQTFDCMRQAGWLDINNPDVQTFIKSIEVTHD